MFLGREVLPHLGTKRFLWLWLGAVFLGGVFWLAVNWTAGGVLVGASAGVAALLVVFACMNPNQPITLLLFFILPVTLRPKYLGCKEFAFCGRPLKEPLGRTSGREMGVAAS